MVLIESNVWQWNWNEKLRDLGIKEADWATVKAAAMSETGIDGDDNAKDIIDRASGYYFRPTNGKGDDLDEGVTVPLEFNGRTYQVGSDGIKVVNEKVLDEIVEESLEREEYVNDVSDLFLHVGNMGVLAISLDLYNKLNDAHFYHLKLELQQIEMNLVIKF